jgi:preprotein translocase subunit SecA
MRTHERIVMLQVVDAQWKDHLYAMDHLKEGIGLRGYGQRDPLIEYKRESFDMFEAMWERIEDEIVRLLFLLQPVREPSFQPRQAARPSRLSFNDPSAGPSALDRPVSGGPRRESQGGVDAAVKTVRRTEQRSAAMPLALAVAGRNTRSVVVLRRNLEPRRPFRE